jgi:hypothetical protein
MPTSRKSKDSAVSKTAEQKKKAAKADKDEAEPKPAKPAAKPAAKAAKKAEPNAAEPDATEDATDEATPLNRAERRALARGKGKPAAAGKAQSASSTGVHPHTGPATTQRQWASRRSGG